MKCFPLFAVALAFAVGLSTANAERKIRTKIIVEADAAPSVNHDVSCLIVYPEEPAYTALADAGVPEIVQTALERKGYLIVTDADQATAFLKVDFIEGEPYQTDITLVQQGSFDYSHAASTRNYATLMEGGRYHSLGDPRRQAERNATGFVLGSDGKPIDVGQQKPVEAEFVEGEETTLNVTVYPVGLEISAWRFASQSSDPVQIWRVTALHQGIEEEPLEEQLDDLAKTAVKHMGKRLKKPKAVTRKNR